MECTLRISKSPEMEGPEDFSVASKLVIGLMGMGVVEHHDIASFMLCEQYDEGMYCEVIRFICRVQSSDNEFVRHAIGQGLPTGMFVDLPRRDSGNRIRCKLCKQNIYTIPCPLCSVMTPHDVPSSGTHRPRPPLPLNPTNAMPGSFQKIRVMQSRLARGEAISHPQDLTLRDVED